MNLHCELISNTIRRPVTRQSRSCPSPEWHPIRVSRASSRVWSPRIAGCGGRRESPSVCSWCKTRCQRRRQSTARIGRVAPRCWDDSERAPGAHPAPVQWRVRAPNAAEWVCSRSPAQTVGNRRDWPSLVRAEIPFCTARCLPCLHLCPHGPVETASWCCVPERGRWTLHTASVATPLQLNATIIKASCQGNLELMGQHGGRWEITLVLEMSLKEDQQIEAHQASGQILQLQLEMRPIRHRVIVHILCPISGGTAAIGIATHLCIEIAEAAARHHQFLLAIFRCAHEYVLIAELHIGLLIQDPRFRNSRVGTQQRHQKDGYHHG